MDEDSGWRGKYRYNIHGLYESFRHGTTQKTAKKLESYGITDHISKWIGAFLTGSETESNGKWKGIIMG